MDVDGFPKIFLTQIAGVLVGYQLLFHSRAFSFDNLGFKLWCVVYFSKVEAVWTTRRTRSGHILHGHVKWNYHVSTQRILRMKTNPSHFHLLLPAISFSAACWDSVVPVMLRRCSQQYVVVLCGQSWWCWACEDKDDCWHGIVNARLWQVNLVLRFEICLDSEKDRIPQKTWFDQSHSSKLPKPPYMSSLAFEKMWIRPTTHMVEDLSSTCVHVYLLGQAQDLSIRLQN